MSVAAMVIGIVSIVTSLFIGSPVAIFLGIAGMRETRDGAKSGRGMAIAGLVLGIIGTLILLMVLAWFAFWIVVLITAGATSS